MRFAFHYSYVMVVKRLSNPRPATVKVSKLMYNRTAFSGVFEGGSGATP